MTKNTLVILIILAVIVLAGVFFYKSQKNQVDYNSQTQTTYSTPEPSMESSVSPSASPAAEMSKNMVTISSSGFSPKAITIKAGDSVTWMNSDSTNHTVNSSPHPTHTDYPPLNLGVIKPGEQKSLMFPTAGTYKYHDHLNPSLTGTVTVQ